MSRSSPPHPILQQYFSSSQVAFTQIDKEIAVLQESIRVLHAFRNTFTPVDHLPPEVLTRIFSLVKHVPNHEVYHIGSNSVLPQWVVVTRVSQYWRNVAVGCPSLWFHITDTYPRHMIPEWVRRSKDTPLSVTLYESSVAESQFIGPALPRIRELTLELPPTTWNGVAQILSSPAPLLESFRVTISDSDTQVPLSTVSDNMFAGTTPSLRRLELVGCPVNIHSSIFTDLTTLQLQDPSQKIPAADLLVSLHRMPRLTSLELTNVLQKNVRLAFPNIDPVTLPFLKSLQIHGESFAQDIDILYHISFPADSTLWFSSEARTGGALDGLLSFLEIHKTSRQQSSRLVVGSLELQYLYGHLTLNLNAKCSDPGHITNLIKFNLGGPWREDALNVSDDTDLAPLFSFFNLDSLEQLDTMNCKFSTGAWTYLFGALPKLKHITNTGIWGIHFLSSLFTDYTDKCAVNTDQTKVNTKGKKKKGKKGRGKQKAPVSNPSSTQPAEIGDWEPIFPCLETIQIVEMTFARPIIEDVVAALRSRKMVDKGIKVFGLTDCRNVDEDVVDLLRGVVDHVEWDGCNGTDDEYGVGLGYDSDEFN
ncbi:hypothetical protein BDN72DRAFT_846209 [Pluteus cervinus]|uniref:Uncharacterized protein n=1 Tax=Pluteus cervinus TaxID=181527 RepID=A0ACD3AJ39_9AGAR|nr:hypothetical protein BDN72DRAFT_846209 [Pluteus cervinus]